MDNYLEFYLIFIHLFVIVKLMFFLFNSTAQWKNPTFRFDLLLNSIDDAIFYTNSICILFPSMCKMYIKHHLNKHKTSLNKHKASLATW